jgi:hypothetical protein
VSSLSAPSTSIHMSRCRTWYATVFNTLRRLRFCSSMLLSWHPNRPGPTCRPRYAMRESGCDFHTTSKVAPSFYVTNLTLCARRIHDFFFLAADMPTHMAVSPPHMLRLEYMQSASVVACPRSAYCTDVTASRHIATKMDIM